MVTAIAWIVLLCTPPGVPCFANGQVDLDPTQIERFYKEGMALVQQKRLDEAIRTFEEGLRLDPNNLVLLNALGGTYSLKGDMNKAQECFLRILKVDPGFVPARKNLAIGYFTSGKYDLALPEFERLNREPAARPLACLFLGMIAEKRKQYDRAVLLFEKSGELVYQNPQAILSLARSLAEAHQLERCQGALEHLGSISSLTAVDYYEAGLLYTKCGRYDLGLENFAKAKQFEPELFAADYQRARVLDKMGRSAEALDILQELTARNANRDSLRLLSLVAPKAGKIAIAAQALRRLIDLEPDLEDNYLGLSRLLMDHENDSLALEVVEAGLSRVPHSYRLHVQRGAILGNLAREARHVFRSAMKLQADNRQARIGLAASQIYAGQITEGVETLKAAVERFPKDFYLHYFYALALRKMTGTPGADSAAIIEKATRALEQSIQLNPNFADSHFLLGKLLVDRDARQAEERLETALRLNPQHIGAKYVLGRLYLRIGKQREGQAFVRQVEEHRLGMEKKPKIILFGR